MSDHGKKFYEDYFNDSRFTSTIWDAGNRYKRWLIKNMAGELKGRRALDIGCGVGDVLFDLAMAGAEAYGIDYSSNSIKFAGDYLKSKNLKATLKVGDAQNLPFGENFFDVVICSEVLEHIPDDSRAVKEMRRVLKKYGIAIITAPSGGKAVKEWGHIRHYSDEKMRKLLEDNGFRIIDIKYGARVYNWLWLYPIKGSFYFLNEIYSRIFNSKKHMYERKIYRDVVLPFVENVIRPIDIYLSKNPTWFLQFVDDKCGITVKAEKMD